MPGPIDGATSPMPPKHGLPVRSIVPNCLSPHKADTRVRKAEIFGGSFPVCTDNLNVGVVVVKSAQDGA